MMRRNDHPSARDWRRGDPQRVVGLYANEEIVNR